jgi:gamma-glutamyltranspeptidase/glutathione hydrolase
MISTQGSATTLAAKHALDLGGNIYDAAIAASFAISVERPHSTGLGGGGFLLSYNGRSKESIAYDFREMAPLKSHSKMFLDKKGKQVRQRSLTGSLASGVPGLVAGIISIHQKYGSLSLDKLVQPAVKLAREGFAVYPALAVALKAQSEKLCKFSASKKIFLKNGCKPLEAGDLLVQEDLAKTLELVAKTNGRDFYQGSIAKKIAASQKANGGLITMRDMKGYKVKQRAPIRGEYKGNTIISMPPPSSGGTHLIQILNILEGYDLKSFGAQSATSIHLTSAAMQIAFADRAKYMGDSDFVEVPLKSLTSKSYAKKLRAKIPMNKAVDSKTFPIPFKELNEPEHTTHFTIMDSEGNIVSSTQTINGWFGSALVAKGTGIMMNNEMDDFASHVGGVNLFGAIGGSNNLVEPRKRPLSSMSPTIVLDQNMKPFLALGTPSGTRILTCVMQTVLNVLEYKMPLWDAVAATRYHHQWAPDEIRIGPPGFSEKTTNKLKKMGYKINPKSLGCKIQAIMKHNDGTLQGVSDPREEGMSYGI